jgi:cytochrome c-type biogenesis protein CcmH
LNANLAASDAAIAADLRAEIHDQIIQGQNDVEIMAFLTERYGEFITYRPPLNKGTILLWFGPGLLLIFGFFIVLRMMRNSQVGVSDSNLSDEETQKLQDILSSHSDQSGS